MDNLPSNFEIFSNVLVCHGRTMYTLRLCDFGLQHFYLFADAGHVVSYGDLSKSTSLSSLASRKQTWPQFRDSSEVIRCISGTINPFVSLN